MQLNQDYHKMLKTFRKNANMTQEDIAFELNIPQSTISRIESGIHIIDIHTFMEWIRVTNSNDQAVSILFGAEYLKETITNYNE